MAATSDKVSMPRRTAAVALMRIGAGIAALGDAVLRPEPVRLLAESERATEEALVARVVALGPALRVELKLADGREVWGRLTREEAELIELRAGQILGVRLAAVEPSALARAA